MQSFPLFNLCALNWRQAAFCCIVSATEDMKVDERIVELMNNSDDQKPQV